MLRVWAWSLWPFYEIAHNMNKLSSVVTGAAWQHFVLQNLDFWYGCPTIQLLKALNLPFCIQWKTVPVPSPFGGWMYLAQEKVQILIPENSWSLTLQLMWTRIHFSLSTYVPCSKLQAESFWSRYQNILAQHLTRWCLYLLSKVAKLCHLPALLQSSMPPIVRLE